MLVLHGGEEKRVQRALFEIILDCSFGEGLAIRALEDLYIIVPVNGWEFQELVRGESVGEAALGQEPIEFLSFPNSNVLEQQARDVAVRQVMDGHTDAISDGSFVAFCCRNMLALRIVKLGIHVVFDVFKESFELDVRINGSDIDGGPIVSSKDIVEGVVEAFGSAVLEWDKSPAFDARINSGEHGHTVDVHDVEA